MIKKKQKKKKRGEIGEREREGDSGWGGRRRKGEREIRRFGRLSVGNRRRDEMLDVCRSLGGPRLPVLTLLGSISREAKQ